MRNQRVGAVRVLNRGKVLIDKTTLEKIKEEKKRKPTES
jgi:hypothetical protein